MQRLWQRLHLDKHHGGYFENEIDDVFLYRADIPIEEYIFAIMK